MCRIKKCRSPLGMDCGMYRKYILSGRGYRESVPCSCHAHGIPFHGDSISFRLPRQPAGASHGNPLHGRSTGWPVLSLNNRKHPAKSAAFAAAFIRCMYCSLSVQSYISCQKGFMIFHAKKNGRTAVTYL